MSYFDSDSYREQIRKKLVESDSLGVGGVHLNKESLKPKYETDVLSSIREKLFGTPDEVNGGENGEPVETVQSDIPNGTGEVQEDTYQEQPKTQKVSDDETAETVESEPELSTDDLGDMATDTIMDILNSIKELRDKVKKEDPKKAALIRRIYDHLLKGKEKITAEIMKAAEEDRGGVVKNEGKW
jgi:molybdopterin converting factor small subunit